MTQDAEENARGPADLRGQLERDGTALMRADVGDLRAKWAGLPDAWLWAS
jgi:hypothetical protein